MAETSTLCFATFSSISRTSKDSSSTSSFSNSSRRLSFLRSYNPSRLTRFTADASDSGNFLGDDSPFGFYPWDSSASNSDGAIQWVSEDKVTLFTADGLIQIGGTMVPRRISPDKRQGKSKIRQRYRGVEESDYMDPKQALCLGTSSHAHGNQSF